jgi:hypothetical protein
MPCVKTTSDSRYVIPHPVNFWIGWRTILKTIVAFADAFHEARDMRRSASRKHPFFDE